MSEELAACFRVRSWEGDPVEFGLVGYRASVGDFIVMIPVPDPDSDSGLEEELTYQRSIWWLYSGL